MPCAVFSLVSLLTVAASPASAPAGVCTPVPGQAISVSCGSDESLYETALTELDAAPADTDEPRFATPAVIDCRVPTVPGPLQALVGECDGTPRDASYRTSRDPDSERAPG